MSEFNEYLWKYVISEPRIYSTTLPIHTALIHNSMFQDELNQDT